METKLYSITTKKDEQCEDCPFYDNCTETTICTALNIDDYITKAEQIDLDFGLNCTILQMISDDYKDRFIAEFNQTYIRFTKLRTMCMAWDKNELKFTPTCPRELYDAQITYMLNYLSILWVRAKLEDVTLEVLPEDVELFNSIEDNKYIK